MKRRIFTGITASFAMLLLILDAKTALSGALVGIELCLRTVIPSLLPFFVLSILLTAAIAGTKIPILHPLGHLCRIPEGSESQFLIGLLGGYPAGAQSIAQAYRAGHLSKQDAKRMLGFCSNAGPAFLFGMVAVKFDSPSMPWLLWGIHILSAVMVGILLPGGSRIKIRIPTKNEVTLSDAVWKSAKIMASVCVWVILFRVIIAFMDRWFLWLFPDTIRVIICGILELSNGCCDLGKIPNEGIRFVVCSGMLAWGGLCVAMQTSSVTGDLGLGFYLPGKLLQGLISLAFASIVSYTLMDEISISIHIFSALAAVIGIFLTILWKKEKRYSFAAKIGV